MPFLFALAWQRGFCISMLHFELIFLIPFQVSLASRRSPSNRLRRWNFGWRLK